VDIGFFLEGETVRREQEKVNERIVGQVCHLSRK
jgi:hypothetical protein